MLAGWGLFNVVEGIVDHLVLGIHHVHPGAYERVWDLGFLAFGFALAAAGVALMAARRVSARRNLASAPRTAR
jgi:uncharacterized membrane protein